MKPELKTRAPRLTEAEARAITDRARRIRAETLTRMLRGAWSRLAGETADVVAPAPKARA